MDKIIYEGKEYKDKLYCNATVEVSLWGRIRNLFCPTIRFGFEVYTEEIMPRHKAIAVIDSVSYWQRFKVWYRSRKFRGKAMTYADRTDMANTEIK